MNRQGNYLLKPIRLSVSQTLFLTFSLNLLYLISSQSFYVNIKENKDNKYLKWVGRFHVCERRRIKREKIGSGLDFNLIKTNLIKSSNFQ
jgi:hypothetical protein